MLMQQNTSWLRPKEEGLLGKSQLGTGSGRSTCMREIDMDCQQKLETGQFAVEQSQEDGFKRAYEGVITQVEGEMMQPDLVQMMPDSRERGGCYTEQNMGGDQGMRPPKSWYQ